MILAIALSSIVMLNECSWDKPGANPFKGDQIKALDNFGLSPKVKQDLAWKIWNKKYDDLAAISLDKIQGKSSYDNLRMMHFGNNKVCATVSRQQWKPDWIERGLVYCSGDTCVIVPTVCNNISLVTKIKESQPPVAETSQGTVAEPGIVSVVPELMLEPPGAGYPDLVNVPVAKIPDLVNEGSTWGVGPPIQFGFCCVGSGQVSITPEPNAWVLFVSGLIFLGLASRLLNKADSATTE